MVAGGEEQEWSVTELFADVACKNGRSATCTGCRLEDAKGGVAILGRTCTMAIEYERKLEEKVRTEI